MTAHPVTGARTWAPRARRPRLALRRRGRLSRPAFALLVLAILGGTLVVLLLLNTVIAQDAFRLHALQRQGQTLDDREQELQRAVGAAAEPANLAARAKALGLGPSSDFAFYRPSDGKVLGGDPTMSPPPADAVPTHGIIVVPGPATTAATQAPAAGTPAPAAVTPSTTPETTPSTAPQPTTGATTGATTGQAKADATPGATATPSSPASTGAAAGQNAGTPASSDTVQPSSSTSGAGR